MATSVTGDVVVTLTLELQGISPGNETPLVVALRNSLGSGVAELMTTLGVPGDVRVTIAPLAEPSTARLPLRVIVNERLLPYPTEILLHAYSYVHDRLLDAAATPPAIAQWIADQSGHGAEDSTLVEFVRETCLEILRRQPGRLLGLKQAQSYAQSLGIGRGPLMAVLPQVLDLGISIANTALVAQAVRDSTPETLKEDLITALRADVVEVQLPEAFLRELSTRWELEGPPMFPFLRDGMFVELGLEFPPLKFVSGGDLRADCFAFKVNALRFLPLHGLSVGECLVNDTAERLRLDQIDARATVNPATGQPASVIDRAAEQMAEGKGLTTWNQLQHLVLSLAEFLRLHGWRMVHRRGVDALLTKFGSVFPTLLATLRERISDDQMTELLRGLIRERVAVRNLRALCEGLLDASLAWHAADAGASTLAERLHASARLALSREIAAKAARGSNALVVYLLDPEIERLAADSASWMGENGERVLDALHAEVTYLPATAQVPHLLTFGATRPAMQHLIALEHPRMSVLAHEELPPRVNVMPIARISLHAS